MMTIMIITILLCVGCYFVAAGLMVLEITLNTVERNVSLASAYGPGPEHTGTHSVFLHVVWGHKMLCISELCHIWEVQIP